MAVDDLWYRSKKDENDKRIPSARHGRGKRYRVRYTDANGEPKQPLFDKKKDADAFDAAVRADVSRGTYVDPAAGRLTFGQYATRWRANQVHADTTALQIETHFRRHVLPKIGDRQLRVVRRSDIQGLVRQVSDDLAPATVEVVYRYVAAVFRAAMADRLIPATPCFDITLPEIEPKRVKPMALDVFHSLRNATAVRFRVLDDLGAEAGLRQGEAFGLEVEHMDFLRKTVRVEQQLKWLPGGGPFLAPPKSKKSYRTIPVGQILVDRVAAHLAEFPAVEYEILDKTGPKPITRVAKLISLRANGLPHMRPKYSYQIWRPAVKAIGVDGPDAPTFHDLRHLYASVLIAHGASVTQVQNRLGHASAAETLKTYSHLWPDEDDRTRDIIDAVFAGRPVPLRAVG